ncbi:MAG TPA: HAD family phosphatase [Firmicutes bacterium]|nr:HAD family phosphatase [Bacillota bacterium]
MKIKLVALDIDGTLLNSQGELTPKTRAVIASIKEKGIGIVLATGRRPLRTTTLAEELNLKLPLITHNGAVIIEPGRERPLLKRGIDLKIAAEIMARLEKNRINYAVYAGEGGGDLILAPSYAWQEAENLMLTYMGEVPDKTGKIRLAKQPVRLSVIDAKDKVLPFYEYLKADFAGQINPMLFTTKKRWRGIEIICGRCSKGAALAFLAERLGIQAPQVVAIGDNVNDLEMITWAGLGAAMANGAPALKRAADLIAPDFDSDGAALFLSELLLAK